MWRWGSLSIANVRAILDTRVVSADSGRLNDLDRRALLALQTRTVGVEIGSDSERSDASTA